MSAGSFFHLLAYMKVNIKYHALAIAIILGTCSLQAQITRPVTPGQDSGGGIWLSGPGINGDGTGIHSGETPVLAIEDSVVNTQSFGAGGAGAGKIVLGDLRIRKAVNGNSLVFAAAAGKGASLASLKFNYYQKNVLILSLTLSDVIVGKYRVFSSDCSGSGNNCSGLYEEITVSFRQMQYADSAGHSVLLGR